MDASKVETARVLRRGTFHHWKILVPGLAVSLSAWVIWGLSVQPDVVYLAMGVSLIVLVAMFLAVHDIRLKRDEYADELTGKLELIADGPHCLDIGHSPSLKNYKNRKIIVTNLSRGRSIEDVHVEITRFKETDKIPDWVRSRNVPLRPEYADVLPDWKRSIPPGAELSVGVFGIDEARPECFRLWHAAPGMADRLDIGDYHIELHITGKNVPEIRRMARIGVENGTPFLRLVT